MKLVQNEDVYTQAYIQEGWAILGFDIDDDFDNRVESDSGFQNYTYIEKSKMDWSFSKKGGFVQIIDIRDMDKNEAVGIIKDLEQNEFIDRQTRSIVVDTVIFNPYTSLYTVINLIAMFEANGLINTRIQLYNIQSNYYSEASGYFRFVCEILFCLLLIFYIILEIYQLKKDVRRKKQLKEREHSKHQKAEQLQKLHQKKESQDEIDKNEVVDNQDDQQDEDQVQEQKKDEVKKGKCSRKQDSFLLSSIADGMREHYSNGWNLIDTAFLVLSIISVAYWSVIITKHIRNITNLDRNDFKDPAINEQFLELSLNILTYSHLCSVNFILIFIKVLKYLESWFERVMIIFKTLSKAKSDIFYFLIMYIIIFFAFVVMCHIYYGADLTEFGTILNSLKTLFLMLLGDLKYLDDMIILNKVLSFFFFVAFMTSMQLILVNMFIAFISNAYSQINKPADEMMFEEQLKQKHWIVKIEESLSWVKRKFSRKKRQERKQTYKEQKEQQEKLKNNFNHEIIGNLKFNQQKEKNKDSDDDSKDSSDNDQQDEVNSKKTHDMHQDTKNKPQEKLLRKMDWDKNFKQNQFHFDEPEKPHLQSEKQEVQNRKAKELKCGKIMWASIAFTIYAALYISLILFQLNVERNFWYNTAIKSSIEQEINGQSINDVIQYDHLINWVNNSFSYVAEEQEIDHQDKDQDIKTAYFIKKVNYILDSKFRLCFKLSEEIESQESDQFVYSEYHKGDSLRYKTNDFIGESSEEQYDYSSNGYQLSGGYCQDISFEQEEFEQKIGNIIEDRIISDQTQQLSLEFVTFEASQYVHTYTSIEFNFPQQGVVVPSVNVFTMRLNQYSTQGDKVRLGFEILYIILLLFNMYIFFKDISGRNKQYESWKRIEISTLKDCELKQRHKKRPEWLRKWEIVVTPFTYFDIIYFTLAITSIVLWILYIQYASNVDFELPPPEDKQDFIPNFYEAKNLLMTYSNVAAINTIFLSVKVFDYMNKSKHMNMLSNTLYTAKEDTFYFLIIFSIFLFGFVGMAYISFGANLSDFSTLGNAVRKCFEITIGDFDYQSLEKTNSTMAIIFFFPFTILFVFILTNIFLAIINEAYEHNTNQVDENDDFSIISSIFFCLIKNEKNSKKKAKNFGLDKDSSNNDHLEVFENLVVNLQISVSDLKAWAVNCADEIKKEMKKRKQLRDENRKMLSLKIDAMKNGKDGKVQQSNKFDELEFFKKRLQYWDYIRNGLQFISFQNKVLGSVLKQKEKEIEEKKIYYEKEKQNTKEIYRGLIQIEKPVQDRLAKIMDYRELLQKLDKERNELMNIDQRVDEQQFNEEEEKQEQQSRFTRKTTLRRGNTRKLDQENSIQ